MNEQMLALSCHHKGPAMVLVSIKQIEFWIYDLLIPFIISFYSPVHAEIGPGPGGVGVGAALPPGDVGAAWAEG